MIEILKNIDEQLFLWLNGQGHPTLDNFMLFLSAKLVWIPLYLGIIFLLYRHFDIQFWKPLLLIILSVTFADQFTSAFMKPYFERPRPCHEVSLTGQVINVGKCGGKYGFASSHAANTFALGVFCLTLTRIKWYWLLVGWAVLVSYSRVHLGVHYPGDILIGGLVGGFFAFGLVLLCRKWIKRK